MRGDVPSRSAVVEAAKEPEKAVEILTKPGGRGRDRIRGRAFLNREPPKGGGRARLSCLLSLATFVTFRKLPMGRRNLTPDQASLLRGRRYNGTKRTHAEAGALKSRDQNDPGRTAERATISARREAVRGSVRTSLRATLARSWSLVSAEGLFKTLGFDVDRGDQGAYKSGCRLSWTLDRHP